MSQDAKSARGVDLVELSVQLQDETGYDSIPTIEAMYHGQCVFPDCDFGSKSPEKMWKHVHFARKHGRSFEASLDDLIASRAEVL